MNLDRLSFIVELASVATAAQKEEISFRRSIAEEIARRERERQFAYRRLDLARLMAAAAIGAGTFEEAHGKQIEALKAELGWHDDSERRKPIFAAWQAVSRAVWEQIEPAKAAAEGAVGDGPTVAEALHTFEDWYRDEIGAEFLAVFDVEIPEMPVVEF